MGHIAKTCPNQGAWERGSGGAGRFYNLDTKKANGNVDLIGSMCYMHGLPLFVIFYRGALQFFIYSNCIKIPGLEEVPLPSQIIVTTTMDSNVETQWACENCPMSVNEHIFLIYLTCLPFERYVVLTMNWLFSNSIYTGCKEKTIFIPIEGATPNDGIIILCV